MSKATVCVDLDGVLNLYDGWRGAEYFHDPRPGSREFLRDLVAADFRVVILTTRDKLPTINWLNTHGMGTYVSDVTSIKPPALVYVDDRGMTFVGSFDGLVDAIGAFKAHWEA